MCVRKGGLGAWGKEERDKDLSGGVDGGREREEKGERRKESANLKKEKEKEKRNRAIGGRGEEGRLIRSKEDRVNGGGA